MIHGQTPVDSRVCSLLGVQILGTGSYLPDNVVTNDDLRRSHGFDPDWIVNRTGIQERRFARRTRRPATSAPMPRPAA